MRSLRAPALAAVLVASLLHAGDAGAAGRGTAAPRVTASTATKSAQQRAREIRTEVARLQRETAAAAVEAERSYDELGDAVAGRVGAEREAQAAQAAADAARDAQERRVRALYAYGGPLNLYATTLLEARSPDEALRGYVMVEAVLDSGRATTAAVTTTARGDAERSRAAGAAALHQIQLERRAAANASRVATLLAAQQRLLAGADAEVVRLIEEDRRRAQAAALARLAAQRAAQAAELAAARRAAGGAGGAATGAAAGSGGEFEGGALAAGLSLVPYVPDPQATYYCPVGPAHSFTDTWGAPRVGHVHQGTDVFAPYGADEYAVTAGTMFKVGIAGIGGMRVWLRADNGDTFYYAHNSANLVTDGQRVKAGDVVGRVGTSGNAASTPPHIHFEAHPGGGAPHNPYPFLKAICG